jgi:hypothetical protein
MNICGDFEAVYRLPGMLSTLSSVIPVIAGTPIVATAAEIAAAFTATIRL